MQIGLNANLREHQKDCKEDELLVGNPEEAQKLKRFCQIVKPLKHQDFDYLCFYSC